MTRSRRGETSRRRTGEMARRRGKMIRRRRGRRGGSTQRGETRRKTMWRRGETMQSPSSRAGWLCSCLLFLFLFYIVCMYAQTQGRLVLPWENIFTILQHMCDECVEHAQQPRKPRWMTCPIYRTCHPIYSAAIHPILLLDSQLNSRISYY